MGARPLRRIRLAVLAGTALVVVSLLAPPTQSQNFVWLSDSLLPFNRDTTFIAYSGCAWVDYDNDGWEDLFVVTWKGSDLYHNNQDGTFSSQADPFDIDLSSYRGTTWGDIDNDGDLDCFLVGAVGTLYRNNGGTFTPDATGDFATSVQSAGWSPAWGDYNNDGFLDLYITLPNGFTGPGGPSRPSRLYVNDGPPNFTFTRIDTGAVSTTLAPYTSSNWSDFDQDGDLDLLVGTGPANNKGGLDYLYRNMLKESGAPGLIRITTGVPATDTGDGQVWNSIDYDNDGDLDLYRTNWANGRASLRPNDLYRNDNGTYVQVSAGPITTDPYVSLSQVWADYDNDGNVDCFVTNDIIEDSYYHNNGDGTFSTGIGGDISNKSQPTWGAAAGDYDNDGDMDLFVQGAAGNRAFLRNDNDNGNAWLKMRLVGSLSNRSGIGVQLHAKATIFGESVWQLREISAQNSFSGHSSLLGHFGFGDATAIDSLVVRWPSGIASVLENVSVNQLITVIECPGADADGDGIADVCDNCVATPNPDQRDIDHDGLADVCDNCPDAANADQIDANSNGVGDACCCTGTTGNANDVGIVDLADLSLLIAYLTSSPRPALPCPNEANVNAADIINLSDLSLLIAYLTAPVKPALPVCP